MSKNGILDLTGHSALITGGSRGIGAATALLMAQAGADIAIFYRRDAKAARKVVAEVIQCGRRAVAFRVDVCRPREVRMGISAAVKHLGGIDILVNNAGIWTYGAIGKMRKKTWDETIRVNLTGVFNVTNAVVPYFRKKGCGKIINVASTAGQRGEPFHSHYAATKGGVIAFTRSIAVELAPEGIMVNCVAPGWVDTDMCAGVFADKAYKESVRKSIPRGRIATPEEIAGPIVFLASDLASNMVGSVLSVNGGNVLAG